MKKLILSLLSYIPRQLPVGKAEFETWANRIIALGGKYADDDSLHFALASILIHADSKHGALPDKYFSDRLRKSASNQVASQVFQDIKTKQAEAAAKQQTEVTGTIEAVTTDGHTTN